MITKKIKHKDSTGVVHEYDIGADAKNISEDQTHRFVSDSDKEKWDGKLDSDGNASFVTALFEPTTGGRINIFSKDTLATMCSKIAKWFADLKNHSFSDLIQNATTADTTRAVSAAVAKNLQDQISAQNTNKSPVGHTHDDRYYTGPQVDTKIANRIEWKTLAGTTGSKTIHLAAGQSIFLFVVAKGGTSNPLVFAGIASAAAANGSDTKIYPIVSRNDGNSSVVGSGNAIVITCGWTYEIRYFYLS